MHIFEVTPSPSGRSVLTDAATPTASWLGIVSAAAGPAAGGPGSERTQVEKQKTEKETPPAPDGDAAPGAAAAAKRGEKVVTEIDDLLDEIDSVLEENAEEFVANYVQKGGQ